MTFRILLAGALALVAFAPATAAPADDRRTPDAVVDAFYRVISAPTGVTRPWWRLRELSSPDARYIEVSRGQDGMATVQSLTTDQFIADLGVRLNGRAFFEVDCYRVKAPFADVAAVISYYETRGAAAGAPVARGLDSFQLVRGADGWRIDKLLFEDEAAAGAASAGYPGCSAK